MSKPGKRSSDNHGIGMLPAFAIATGGFCLIATAILWDTIAGGTSGIDLGFSFLLVPEPNTFLMILSGLGVLLAFRKRK